MSETEIGVADVLRALAVLRPASDGTVAAVIWLLGFDLLSSVRPAGPPIPEDPDLDVDEEPVTVPDVDESGIEVLTPVAHEDADFATGTSWRAAAPVQDLSIEMLMAPLPYEPLLAPGRAPSIIAAVTATALEENEPDPDALVELIADGRAVDRVPHRQRATMVRGVQVLLDHGWGMDPFARDQAELLADIRSVVGRSAVEPVSFRDAPTRGALPEGRRRWQDYVPPAAGTPVLAITDLGIGGPPVHPARARAGEWADFAAQLDRRESALVALVPYPRSRWPRWVGRTLTAIPWDRTTTLSTALTALRWAGRPR